MTSPVEYHYDRFPPTNIDWQQLVPLIGSASAALARYDATLMAIPNATILLSPLSTQEAVLSSKIEGTQATMGEVLEFEAEQESSLFTEEKKSDIDEILNYRQAMWHAIELLRELPLCNRVIHEAHRVLLAGVRGQSKTPGQYRKIANWIGSPGCQIDQAKFVPISADKLPDAMTQWEKFIHQKVPSALMLNELVQLAIIHAEFEAIHPYLDGNGRLGRMCVPLFMYKIGLINKPTFYISAYFEKNRDEYYERLLAVSRDDDWTGWCKFFLTAILDQASENQTKATEILTLYENKKDQILKLTRSQYAIRVLDFIFCQPIFRSTTFTSLNEIPTPTAKRILPLLRDNGILKALREPGGRRPAMYIFSELLRITEGDSVI